MPPKRSGAGKRPRPAKPYRVFVSHASADKFVARTFCEMIDAIPGIATFRDDRDIRGGDHIPEVIWAEVRAADELLVLLTSTAITRIWVGMEIGMAHACGKRIVPIWYNIPTSSVSLFANIRGYPIERFEDYLSDLRSRTGPYWEEEVMRTAECDWNDVYLIHDPSETTLAEAIDYRLLESGLRCHTHAGEVSSDEDFEATIHQMLDASRSVAVLVSKAAAGNQVIAALAAAAWARDLPVFILRSQVHSSEYSPFYHRFRGFNLWSGFPRFAAAIGRVPQRESAS